MKLNVTFDDSDEGSVEDIKWTVPSGFVQLVRYGWCNDIDWDEGPVLYKNITDDYTNSLDANIVAKLQASGVPFLFGTAAHEDDDYNNRGTSETNAFFEHMIVVREDALAAAIEVLNA